MSLNLGRMRHVIDIQEQSTAQTATGAPVDEWADVATQIAASYEPQMSGHEYEASKSREARVPTVFRIRWRDGIWPRMRVVYDDRWFDIQEAQDPDGLHHELKLTTEELVAEPL